ncbi:hypothetical protein ANCCEY_06888 [Ancylostoma ceylanicum]|uniref:Reverse transcriptase domain-containing protein n=1 Tax=Ancylostoma ceylanicum TaxID=53326 RepID=A0A0D6M278_9BILA|nr:hypothetical protein ANCCEY_06888 [Ancylostoma ceylanicum]
MDHIHTIIQLIERRREYTMPLILIFVDYGKASNSVEPNAVLNALIHAGVDPAYVNILEQCNIGTTTTIQLFDKKLHIPIEKSVRQGDTISPKLFTSALQYAMSRLNWDDKGLMIDGKKLSNLRFADDIVLISDNRLEMNQLLNELNEAGKAIGLEMNMKKTQMMANQWCDDGEVQLDGITLKKVDSYVYLGREGVRKMFTGNKQVEAVEKWPHQRRLEERVKDQRPDTTHGICKAPMGRTRLAPNRRQMEYQNNYNDSNEREKTPRPTIHALVRHIFQVV